MVGDTVLEAKRNQVPVSHRDCGKLNTEQCKNSDQATSRGRSELRESDKNYEEQETGRLGQTGKVSSVCRRNKTWLECVGYSETGFMEPGIDIAYVCRFVYVSVCMCIYECVGER